MLNRFLPLAIAGTLIVSGPVAWAADEGWVDVTENAVGDRFLVHQSSIQRQGNSARYWEYRTFQQPNNAFLEVAVEQPVYGVVLFQSVDCVSGVTRMRRVVVLDQNRQTIRSLSYGENGPLSQPQTGSSSATVVQFVCSSQPNS